MPQNNLIYLIPQKFGRTSLGDKGVQYPLQKDLLDLALFEREKPWVVAMNAAHRGYQGLGEVCFGARSRAEVACYHGWKSVKRGGKICIIGGDFSANNSVRLQSRLQKTICKLLS